jgi:DNA-binding NtrC family response regulator
MRVKPHILVVDDEPNLRKVLRSLLEQSGYGTTTAASGSEALELVRSQDPDLVLTDVRMPGMDGLELLRELQAGFPEIPVVILTAYATVDLAVEAMKRGAHDFIAKPFDKAKVKTVIQKALAQAERQRREFQGPLHETADCGMVGRSPAVEEIRRLITRVAPSRSTVLITGETGTGKELVAEALHSLSPRRDRPLVKINCGALPESLVEAELFGHERGAFTGADRARPGRFELADGGTLFLDEVGELPPAVQVKLLRVLQDGIVDRVGSTASRHVDVRLVSATNRDPREMVKTGMFREDLLYRLQVIEIPVPPLRERTEDIPLLVDFFVAKHAARLGHPRPGVAPTALDPLAALSWPGNIRELENVVERALLLSEGPEILTFHEGHPAPPLSGDGTRGLKEAARAAAAAAERRLILAALRATGGNVTHAAGRLALSRRGLQLKMKQLGIRPGDDSSA